MADEATLDSTMEAELEALLTGTAAPAAAADKGVKPDLGEKASPAASPETPETPAGDPLLAALDAIEEEKEVKPEEGKGALSEDQQQVLAAIPDVATATNLYNTVQGYHNLTDALESGKFEDVESMLTKWNPTVLESWIDHVYEKHKVAFVDRFIEENDPEKGPANKGLTKLQREFNELKKSLDDKKVDTAKSEEQTRLAATFAAYNKHVDDLFEKIKFNAADRRWVNADLKLRIADDPKVLAAIKGGKPAAVNALFKAACREYVNRDKVVAEEKGEKIKVQGQKKLPVGGGAGEVDQIPDDINKVKPEDRDKWQEREIAKLVAANKKK